MRENNYKGEMYLDTSHTLLIKLDAICETLIHNLKTNGKSYIVEEIIKNKSFNKLWEHAPNTPDKKNSKKEFKALYAFATCDNDKIDFMYMGISQRTRGRFSDHTKRNKSKDASWAYLMIKHNYPLLTRVQRENKISEYQKKSIHHLRFTFYPIDDNMLLHLAEVYCVNKLKAFWNSFETH
jgi:hypothetical protein